MKRHSALIPLSKEHHDSLILAQVLKKDAPAYKGLPTDPAAKSEFAQKKFKDYISMHFDKEEAVLHKLRDCHNEIQKLGDEIIREHQQLKAAFLSLRQSQNLETDLDKLGHALEEHIRKEERILFPLIQDYVPEEMLTRIAPLIL